MGPVIPVCEIPFTLHSYVGFVPPFVGVAVKVTAFPAHDGFALAVILTPATISGLTVIDPEATAGPQPPSSGIE